MDLEMFLTYMGLKWVLGLFDAVKL